MPLTNAAKHRALNHLVGNAVTGSPITHASAHSGYPSTSGANEITGGSPLYARKALTFEAVAGTETAGSIDVTSSPVFDIPASTNVAWIGFWTAVSGGTFMAWAPNGGGAYMPFNVDDASTDLLDSKAHGFSNTNTVVVWGASLPAGISEGIVYFVVSAATDSLKLALTSGGSAIDLTTLGSGHIQSITVAAYAGQGQHTLTDADIAL